MKRGDRPTLDRHPFTVRAGEANKAAFVGQHTENLCFLAAHDIGLFIGANRVDAREDHELAAARGEVERVCGHHSATGGRSDIGDIAPADIRADGSGHDNRHVGPSR